MSSRCQGTGAIWSQPTTARRGVRTTIEPLHAAAATFGSVVAQAHERNAVS